MTRNAIRVGSGAVAIPMMLWLAGQVFGYGVGFDKPSIPQGAHLQGPAGKGVVTYTVNSTLNPPATIQFDGRCGNSPVTTGPIDVTQITNAAAFATATDKEIADRIEGFFTNNSAAVNAFQGCYQHASFGIYITAVNKSLMKTPNLWVGEVTIQGVRF